MTPKRVKEIANGCCNYICGNGKDFDAINLAITQAVNEALTEAINPVMSEAMFWSDSGDTRAYAACELIIGAIDAMKIPEEA